ncbi:hypothetical protein PsorP6_007237 [Peronosclerospora sorghi]|uniref:Uncharacterized protein n=1 Tax=Peronosclerospora sorghi TaxID=230839 RepID=A0ACC0WA94_9STRA|nr:hypothetical protein PsorP6_007237 [Peronosclerospora sorghi]
MARSARGVTCLECGCLNFSLEHKVCDKCRSKTRCFLPTAARFRASAHDFASRAPAWSKKRRYTETTSLVLPSTNTAPKQRGKQQAVVKKQPEIIDLISDEDEDNDEDNDVALKPPQPKQQDEVATEKQANEEVGPIPCKSRVFPSIAFVESDFPSLEVGVLRKKEAVEKKVGGAFPPAQVQTIPTDASLRDPSVSLSQSLAIKPELANENHRATSVNIVETCENTDAILIQSAEKMETPSCSATNEKETERLENQGDPFFQSRIFDSVEFQGCDFVTVFNHLAAARRSFPPLQTTAATSNSVTSLFTSSDEATMAKNHTSSGVTELGKTASLTAAARDMTTATNTSVPMMKPAVTEAVSSKEIVSAPVVDKTTPKVLAPVSPTSSSVSVSRPVSIPSAQVTAPPPAVYKPPLPQEVPVNVSVKTIEQPVLKPASTSTHAGRRTTPAVTISPSSLAVATSNAMESATKEVRHEAVTMKHGLSTIPPVPCLDACVPAEAVAAVPLLEPTPATGKANVLIPKKKPTEGTGRSNEEHMLPVREKQGQFPANEGGSGSTSEIVRDLAPVKPPALGDCRPEFLDFMRECGDDDFEDEEDPEAVRRAQLKLLDVVDLISDASEEDESGTSEPASPALVLPVSKQAGQGSHATASAGSVPLPSERKRLPPERVVCELCEEKALVSRLIRCPTCTKYYHKKCAKENGDENICWNCDLGAMIDDSALDDEHAKHASGYLAYLKSIRRSFEEREESEVEDEREQDDDGVAETNEDDRLSEDGQVGEDAESESSREEGEEKEDVSVANEMMSTRAGTRWKAFLGDATADIDATYVEVTNRIVQELGDEETRRRYSRGFVSREEFEAQMTAVEEYYIHEEARLQQLEREKALEAKKGAESRDAPVVEPMQAKMQTEPCGDESSRMNNRAVMGTARAGQDATTTGSLSMEDVVAPTTTSAVSSRVPYSTGRTSSPVAVAQATHSTSRAPPVPVFPSLPAAPVPLSMFPAPFQSTFEMPAPVTGAAPTSLNPS